MQNPLTTRRYPLSDAADASGVPSKVIRNWIDRKQVQWVLLDANKNREDGGWRQFSAWDIVRVALAKRLVDFGVPVATAGLTVGGLFSQHNRLLGYSNTPPEAFAAALQATRLYMWPKKSGGWNRRITTLPDEVPADLPDTYLVVDISAAVRGVVDALNKITEAK